MSEFLTDLGLKDPTAIEVVDLLMQHYTVWIANLLGAVDGDPLVEIEQNRRATIWNVKTLQFTNMSEDEEMRVKRIVIGVLEHTYDFARDVHAVPPRSDD